MSGSVCCGANVNAYGLCVACKEHSDYAPTKTAKDHLLDAIAKRKQAQDAQMARSFELLLGYEQPKGTILDGARALNS